MKFSTISTFTLLVDIGKESVGNAESVDGVMVVIKKMIQVYLGMYIN